MTTYVNMTSNVAISAPMCPQPLMVNALQRAAQKFFTESRVWRETLDALYVLPKVRDIDVDQPDGARIVSILDATFDGDVLTPKTPIQLNREVSAWRTTAAGDPKYITMLSPDIIRLAPHPKIKGKLTVEVALAPTLTALSIPDGLAEEYQTALEHGATQILLAIPKKPWSDPSTAMYHAGQFKTTIATAFARQSRAYTGATLRTRLEHR